MHKLEYVIENEMHKVKRGFWNTNRSLNVEQTTRPSDSQFKKKQNLPNSSLGRTGRYLDLAREYKTMEQEGVGVTN